MKFSHIFTYSIVSVGIYNGLIKKTRFELEQLLNHIFWTSGVFAFLYYYGYNVSMSIGGLNLFYGGSRFTGGALNPHQLALYTGVMFF